ncbi:CBS domain-containing protein, partial [Streptomyces sp. WAC01526]|uniref:CBS domain-containing protein n=1 Tax=Streptomyces sp. WAC01526 TaxID=2588709 RepID=UPI0037DD42DA
LGAPATPYVAEFVGTDRALKQLSVTGIDRGDLERPPFARLGEPAADALARLRTEGARWAVVLDEEGALHGWVGTEELADGEGTVASHARRMEAWVPVTGTLKAAFSEMLKHDAGWIAVLDGKRFLGVLTPTTLHEALRRTIGSDERGVPRERAEVDSVPTE